MLSGFTPDLLLVLSKITITIILIVIVVTIIMGFKKRITKRQWRGKKEKAVEHT